MTEIPLSSKRAPPFDSNKEPRGARVMAEGRLHPVDWACGYARDKQAHSHVAAQGCTNTSSVHGRPPVSGPEPHLQDTFLNSQLTSSQTGRGDKHRLLELLRISFSTMEDVRCVVYEDGPSINARVTEVTGSDFSPWAWQGGFLKGEPGPAGGPQKTPPLQCPKPSLREPPLQSTCVSHTCFPKESQAPLCGPQEQRHRRRGCLHRVPLC